MWCLGKIVSCFHLITSPNRPHWRKSVEKCGSSCVDAFIIRTPPKFSLVNVLFWQKRKIKVLKVSVCFQCAICSFISKDHIILKIKKIICRVYKRYSILCPWKKNYCTKNSHNVVFHDNFPFSFWLADWLLLPLCLWYHDKWR